MVDAILVTYDFHESPEQRKERIKLGLPLKTYSFTVERENEQPRKPRPDRREKKASG
jgi:hypothetical protein